MGNQLATQRATPDQVRFAFSRTTAWWRWLRLIASMALGTAGGLLAVVWQRRLIQILGPAVDGFAWGLLPPACGIVAGWVALRQLGGRLSPTHNALSCTVLYAMITTVLGQRLGPVLNALAAALHASGLSPSGESSLRVGVLITIAILPALGIGASLRLLASREAGPTHPAWRIYTSWGGSVAIGACCASRALLPRFGTLPVMAAALCLLVAVLCASHACHWPPSPMALIYVSLSGITLFGLDQGLGSRYWYGQPPSAWAPVKFFKVGRFEDVRIIEDRGRRVLQIDGVPAGGDEWLRSEVSLALLPRLVRPGARSVLLVGFGTGSACGGSMDFPWTRVTCVEREPAVLLAGSSFRDLKPESADPPSLALIQDSFGAALRGNPGFDIIEVNEPNPCLPGASEVLSLEFIKHAKSALSSNGVLAYLLRVESFSPAGLALVARRTTAAFPHCAIARLSNSDCILLASSQPLAPSLSVVVSAGKLVNANEHVRTTLKRFLGTDDIAGLLLEHLWLADEGVRKLGRRDDEGDLGSNSTLQHSSASIDRRGSNLGADNLASRWIDACADVNWFRLNFTSCGCTARHAPICHRLASELFASGQDAQAVKVLDWALQIDPREPDLLADRLIWSLEQDPQPAAIIGAEQLAQLSPESASRVARALSIRGRYKEAITVLGQLRALCPASVEVWLDLEMNYRAIGDLESAGRCFTNAMNLEPLSRLAQRRPY